MHAEHTILVTCSRLVDLAGAEITVLELTEAFARMGWTVSVAAYELGDDMRARLNDLGATYFDLADDACFRGGPSFELVWLHHCVTAYRVLLDSRVRVDRAIFSSLSWFEPVEAPPLSPLRISRYLVNSHESLDRFLEQYPELHADVSVFHNAAPSAAWERACGQAREVKLARLAVVSNHPPEEVTHLVGHLVARNIVVDRFGLGARRERVTPELVERYDGVITIGKTVQYCIARGVPVYVYDQYGGDGWLSPAGFERARRHNFSGRGSRGRVSAATLVDEILGGHAQAAADVEVLRGLGRPHFVLEDNLVRVLADLGHPFSIRGLNWTDQRLLQRQNGMFLNQRRILANANAVIAARESEIDVLRNELARTAQALARKERDLERSKRELARLQGSYSWRLTRPLRGLARSAIRGRDTLQVRVSWARFLVERSQAVIRHQGVGAFLVRASRYAQATGRRTFAAARTRRLRQLPQPGHRPSSVLVSFIIPVYDRTEVLREAIESALNQTVRGVEVVIVTDGSPRETLEVVERYASHPRVRVFHYPRSSGNAVRGRNKAIAEARGRYVAFLDSDDVAMPDRIERCLPLLEHGEADVVYGAWQAVVDGTRKVPGIRDGQVVMSPDADLPTLLEACVPCQSTVMLRKGLFESAGLVKPSMRYREDHELWARLANQGAVFKSVPAVLTRLRLHAGNNELNFEAQSDYWLKRVREEYRQPGPQPSKIAFILPGVGISGGIAVVFKHAELLMQAGHDAFVINTGEAGDGAWYTNNPVPIVHVSDPRLYVFEGIDLLIATGWSTVEWLERLPARRKLYFVQSDERRFHEDAALKARIHQTYHTRCEYFSEARWIVRMLRDEFGHEAHYVPNGIDTEIFFPDAPLEPTPKTRLRVLIEGPIVIPFKGVREAYEAVAGLDCELWIVSSAGSPPRDWKYDRFFDGVPFGEMRRIYSSCDIFVKMSRVEGFFGPPMEAMACGCAVVVGKVSGYDEYIVDGVNAIVVETGDVPAARRAVERLLDDEVLRQRLLRGGRETVAGWSWQRSADAMLALVEGRGRAPAENASAATGGRAKRSVHLA